MPFDAICLRAVVHELSAEVLGARIEKVQQPARDLVILQLRGGKRLLLNGGANQPRLQLTQLVRDNPMQPPMFCMLLRKHLTGGRILSVEQPDLERVVVLTVEVVDELGELGQRKLVLETMGRHSNLLLLDGEGRILECLRRVDFDMSQTHPALPGLFYHLPTAQNKRSLLDTQEETLRAMCASIAPQTQMDKWLLDTFFGISPLIAREIAYRGCGATDYRCAGGAPEAFVRELLELRRISVEQSYVPTMLCKEGTPSDFTFMDVRQYGAVMTSEARASFCELLDEFYETRERIERTRQRGHELLRAATTARDRTVRKIAMQEKEYAATQDRDALRIRGDLITANLYRMKKGERVLHAENYYDEAGGTLDVALDPLLTPQQNAARYYKQYNKAKTAQRYLRELLEKGWLEKEYLESVLQEIDQAETEQDFLDIRHELLAAGYLRTQAKGKKEMHRASKPREFRSSAGLRILVGRNNMQNDKLSMKDADKRDIWLHTQKIHGSHVILCTQGASADEQSIREAAMLAAWFSQAATSSQVPVDYTAVRNVKKPAGARPGMVIYQTYKTIYVTPERSLAAQLSVKG